MKYPQIYETTVFFSRDISAHVLSIPNRSFYPSTDAHRYFSHSNPSKRLLGLEILWRFQGTAVYDAVVIALFQEPDLIKMGYSSRKMHFYDRYSGKPSFEAPRPPVSKSIKDAANAVMHEAILPIELSPLGADSLTNFLGGASATALGAYAGYLLAGPTPLLLLAAPAGIIIMGAAYGVAKGLEEGLRKRLVRLISPDDS